MTFNSGFRAMRPEEAALFSSWENAERPYPWTERQFSDILSSSVERIVVLEGGLPPAAQGFGVFQVIEEEAYLLNIMVDKPSRRQGWGQKILLETERLAFLGGARLFYLDVAASNHPAISLYTKMGYDQLGGAPSRYPNGEPGVLMRKILPVYS